MSENDLRDALSALSAPGVPPAGGSARIHAGVRRAAWRRRLVLGSGVLVTGLAVTGGALWLEPPGGDGSGPGAWAPPVSDLPRTTLPYEAPFCPRDDSDAPSPYGLDPLTLPPLDDVTSIRLCSFGEDWDALRPSPSGEQILVPAEALVFGLEDFEEMVGELPPADRNRCAAVDFYNAGPLMVVTHANGSRSSFRARMCLQAERFDDTAIDLGGVYDLVMRLLDEQRSAHSYELPDDQMAYSLDPARPVPCRTFGETGPVQPGREWLVAATACGRWVDEGEVTTTDLTPEQLQRLNAAFADAELRDAGRLSPFGVPLDPDECFPGNDEAAHLAVRTQRGDVVDLWESSCGWLYLRGWELGTSWRVDLTLDDLT